MVEKIQAYRSSTGAIFTTEEEARMDEIREAAERLAGVEKNHLINVASGRSTCDSTRKALLRLARELRELPEAKVA